MHYVISDIHGNTRRFASIMAQIRLQPEDTLYVLGDVVDRHDGGIAILLQLMQMPNVKMVLGNHEYLMLRALGCPYDNEVLNPFTQEWAIEHWYRNGGQITHQKWKRRRKENREKIINFLYSLPLSLDLQLNGINYKLVHAAPAELYDFDKKYKDAMEFAVWKRLWPEDVLPEDYILVFGHTPTKYFEDIAPMQVWKGQNRIGIDCGSGYPEDPQDPKSKYGRLACLRLDDGKIFYSQEEVCT